MCSCCDVFQFENGFYHNFQAFKDRKSVDKIIIESINTHSSLSCDTKAIIRQSWKFMCFPGIEVLEQERRFIKQARKEVETQAQKMLEQGMTTQVLVLSCYMYLIFILKNNITND